MILAGVGHYHKLTLHMSLSFRLFFLTSKSFCV